jgi:hypothetical protein
MTHKIEISNELYSLLEREARPFVETTPEAVIRRLLEDRNGSYPSERGTGSVSPGSERRATRGRTRSSKGERARRGSLLHRREYELPILRARS